MTELEQPICPSCREPLTYPSGDGCANMTKHADKTMSDDLVKRLRFFGPPIGEEAADRIEELEAAFANMQREYDKRGKRIEELTKERDEWQSLAEAAIKDDAAKNVYYAEMSAKLAKAVEDFEMMADTDPDDGTTWFHEFAHAAIAKIKGEQP